MRRIVLSAVIGLGFAVPATVAVIGTSSQSAFATGSSVTCKSLTGNATGSITIAKCKPKNASYKSATGMGSSLATGGPLTWSPSGKTTIASLTLSSPGQGACATGSTEEDATGTVSGGTAKKYTKKGDVVSVRACVDANGNVSLVPGTKVDL